MSLSYSGWISTEKNKLPFLLWTKNLVTAKKETCFLTNGTNICSKLDGFPLPSRCFINKRKHLRICGWLHVMVENLWNLLKQLPGFLRSFKKCNLFSDDMPNMVLMLKKNTFCCWIEHGKDVFYLLWVSISGQVLISLNISPQQKTWNKQVQLANHPCHVPHCHPFS